MYCINRTRLGCSNACQRNEKEREGKRDRTAKMGGRESEGAKRTSTKFCVCDSRQGLSFYVIVKYAPTSL